MKVTGDAKKEAVAINKSLTCLGDVIFARVFCNCDSFCLVDGFAEWNWCVESERSSEFSRWKSPNPRVCATLSHYAVDALQANKSAHVPYRNSKLTYCLEVISVHPYQCHASCCSLCVLSCVSGQSVMLYWSVAVATLYRVNMTPSATSLT